MNTDAESEKRMAAEAAAELIEAGMLVGLGTGSTVSYLLDAIATRRCDASFVATSPRTEASARALGLRVVAFDEVTSLDLAIDGADQVAQSRWLIKGAGAALTREKIVAACAERFVVIVDASKLVDALRAPVPLELLGFGLSSTLARLEHVRVRAASPSPDGGVIADFTGDVGDPAQLSRTLSSTPGVVEHGLFEPALVSDVLVGDGGVVRHMERQGAS